MAFRQDRPKEDDAQGWFEYWALQGEKWRSQPEIPEERQSFLLARQAITPDEAACMFPFGGITLTRADIEWLISIHKARSFGGFDLDLRGAILSHVDLRQLPLGSVLAGLHIGSNTTSEQYEKAAIHLENAVLDFANLDASVFTWAHAEGASFYHTSLRYVNFDYASLERATFVRANLENTNFSGAHLEGSSLAQSDATRCLFSNTHLEQAMLMDGVFREAVFWNAHLAGTYLQNAHFEGARLDGAHFEGIEMVPADLENVRQLIPGFPAELPPADLRRIYLDAGTDLTNVVLGDNRFGFTPLADVRWGEANLAVVNWRLETVQRQSWRRRLTDRFKAARDEIKFASLPPINDGIIIGDESEASNPKRRNGLVKDDSHYLEDYRAAVRANRQLATRMRAQGMSEEADYFAYRGEVVQREVLRREGQAGRFAWSTFLDLVAGYGYKPLRTVRVYCIAILLFASLYLGLSHMLLSRPLSPVAALVFSIASFHGRGFFPTGVALDDPLIILAAFEAIIGLLIEVSFIATFTQRFFGTR